MKGGERRALLSDAKIRRASSPPPKPQFMAQKMSISHHEEEVSAVRVVVAGGFLKPPSSSNAQTGFAGRGDKFDQGKVVVGTTTRQSCFVFF